MDAKTIKEGVGNLSAVVPFERPATGWYAAATEPKNIVAFDETWTCMFSLLERLYEGKRLCFSAERHGCAGAAGHLGLKEPPNDAGSIMAEQNKYKKTLALGCAFYEQVQAPPAGEQYTVMAAIEDIEDEVQIEVVNLWVGARSVTALVTLANFDRSTNDNVIVPFASGCQGLWTIPYKERLEAHPKAVIGGMDPTAREYLPPDVLVLSIPANRFMEMVRNIPDSFLGVKKE